MITRDDKNVNRGQTALVLILLTAAALIFLAITLNWGRIAQAKSQMTIAVDQAASLLASDAASYGEMNKQSYLQNTNKLTELGGFIMAIIMLIVAIIVLIASYGSAWYLVVLAVVAVVAAVATLVLQIVVIQPGITSMWNKLQQSQPIVQQFVEGGIGAALQGSVGDQVSVADYFDWNGNGIFGANSGVVARDAVPRYAVFYTDRLKMFNGALPPDPNVVFFYNQLNEFVNGETCGQNAQDHKIDSSIPINANCADTGVNCITTPTDPVCQQKVPNGFQLNDGCVANSSYQSPSTYNPYCDPCCQPLNIPNPGGKPDPMPIRPSGCPTDDATITAECGTNNPYTSVNPSYLYIYDPAYQNYADQVSFLAQFGRDQQVIPSGATLPITTLTPNGSVNNKTYFPNGIYGFFWEMNHYSPQVDGISPVNTTSPLVTPIAASEQHWCTHAVAGTYNPSTDLKTALPALTQLSLPYSCTGKDCCVNFLPDSVGGSSGVSVGLSITVGSAASVVITPTGSNMKTSVSSGVTTYVYQVGGTSTISAKATEASGSFTAGYFYVNGSQDKTFTNTPAAASPWTFDYTNAVVIPSTAVGSSDIYATAVDSDGVTSTSSTVDMAVVNPTVSITSPASGDSVVTGTAIIVKGSVTVTSLTGVTESITKVVVTGPGTCTVTGTNFTCPSWSPAVGTYSLTATATDNFGFTATSSPAVSVTILPNTGTSTSSSTGT